MATKWSGFRPITGRVLERSIQAELAGQTIEAEHVFNVHLGETVAPYILLEPLNAILPLSRTNGELLKKEDGWHGVDPLALGSRMRRRWATVSGIWDSQKGSNNRLTLLERIDYVRNLSVQRATPRHEIRVAYSANGRPTCAILFDDEALIDNALMWIPCATTDEAHYLESVINSDVVWDAASRFMSRGQFGGRNMKKLLWHLPVPEYDDSNTLHVKLAEAGEAAAVGTKALWDEMRAEKEDKGQSTSVTVARREIRKWLSESEEGQRVEELVGRLLGG